MAEPAIKPLTVEEFFRWQESQPELYELVRGRPQLMAGAKNVHDDIVVNVVSQIKQQSKGSGCRPFTGDGAVRTGISQIRRPDVGLDCGDRRPDATMAADPRLVVEVLSPSTRDFDAFEKLDEYKRLEGLLYVMLVEPNMPYVKVWSRGNDGAWSSEVVTDMDATVALPRINLALSMQDIYDGVVFRTGPRLVADEDGSPGPGPR